MHERTATFIVDADLITCLDGHTQHGDDLLDRWDGTTLIRTTPDPPHVAPIALALDLHPDGPRTHVCATVAAHRPLSGHDVQGLTTAQFRLPNGELEQLCAADSRVSGALGQYRAMGLLRTPDLLHAAVRIVTAQQINGRLALRLRRELVERCGSTVTVGRHRVGVINARQLAATTADQLRELGCSAAKAKTLIRLARSIRDGGLTYESLHPLDTDELLTCLRTVPGIGRWSAEWLAVRVFDRDRVVAGDLLVRRAVGWLYDLDGASEREVRACAAHWGAASSVAQAAATHAYREHQIHERYGKGWPPKGRQQPNRRHQDAPLGRFSETANPTEGLLTWHNT